MDVPASRAWRSGLIVLLLLSLGAQDPADPKRAVERALAAGKLEEASALLDQHADEAEEPGWKTLRRRLQGIRELREGFEAGREAAQGRVRAAKDAIAGELQEETQRETRIGEALKNLTQRDALRLALPGGLTLEGVRASGYSGGRVKLTWPQGEVEYPISLLPEEARAALLGGIASKLAPRDLFELAKLLVLSRDFERAGRYFATAAQREPALAPFVPDLDRIRRAGKIFEGSFKATGNQLSLRWGFSTTAEAGDFHALEGTLQVKPGVGLELGGPTLALASAREIPFRDRIKVSALAREADSTAHLLGLQFEKPGGGTVLIYGALATVHKVFLGIRIEDGKSEQILPPTPGAAGNRLTMEFNRGRFVFKVGEQTVWTGNEGGFSDVAVIVGGMALTHPSKPPTPALAVFKELTLFGEVNPLWMAKKQAAYRDALFAELAKERQLGRESKKPATVDLSVDGAGVPADPAAQSAYVEARGRLKALLEAGKRSEIPQVLQAMETVTGMDPAFAPAWYFRGLIEGYAGSDRSAAAHYDRALFLLPDFPEALCARGLLDALAGKAAPARLRAERALELKSDFSEAYLLLARLDRLDGAQASALEGARLAQRLSPEDPILQERSQMLLNVIRGPSWGRSQRQETPHYLVQSDLPAAKGRAYAEHLEAVRPLYAEVLGKTPPPGRRSEVLVFESAEGYHGYMDVTAGGRQEHTLGAFSPWHGQMALFEDVDPSETFRVLAHEGFHQFLHALLPETPIWFNEGMAEYVAASKIEKGKLLERGGILSGRLENLKAGFKYGWRYVPFDLLMTQSQEAFYGEHAALKYAQAWSMIRFFMDGEQGSRRKILSAYVARLFAGDEAGAAYEATFGREDLKSLEAAWLKYYDLKPPAPKPGAAPDAAVVGGFDLLAHLRVPGRNLGNWRLTPEGLVSTRFSVAVDLEYLPGEEYDFRLTVQRVVGWNGLQIGLQGGGKAFVAVLDQNNSSYLSSFDAPAPPPGTTAAGVIFLPGRQAYLECAVRKDGVRISINGKVLLQWQGDFTRFRPPFVPPGKGGTLYLAPSGSEFLISELSVRSAAPKAAPPAPESPEAPDLAVLKGLKEQLASKVEGVRIQAVTRLGALRGREARTLLLEKLVSADTELVSLALARAVVEHRHPASAEALGRALRANARNPVVADAFIRALGTLDMCASLGPLIGALELEDGRFSRFALDEILRIGCVEAATGLAAVLKRAELEERKPEASNGFPNRNKNYPLARLAAMLRGTLEQLSGTRPPPNESWVTFVSRGGLARKMISIYACPLGGAAFEVPVGKSVTCPQADSNKAAHEDILLKHRRE